MNIYTYTTGGGKDIIYSYIDSLSKNEKAQGLEILELLQNNNSDILEILDTRHIKDKVWEIKFGRNRFMYILLTKDDLYVLHACKKEKNKTEKHDKEVALKRAKSLDKE